MANQPSSYYTSISHDYDVIWVWLNPVALYTVQGAGNIQFNGFAFDANNPVGGMDVVPIQVGVLNGHFSMPASLQVALNRSWEKDVAYATGDGPAINAIDLANILAANPFTNPNYVVAPGVSVSADGRFGLTTPYANGSLWQTLSYLPGTLSESFTNTYSASTTVQSGVSNLRTVTYGVDVSVSASAVASLQASLKTSNSQTWTNGINKHLNP
ncbi:hypothetical protein DBR42_10700 [Pelomonas sp. HMWF004]|nr:hypothetical protein DBR42_10700 [Pelomonas sp. HMWF004]